MKRQADQHRTRSPLYHEGQLVWDIPLRVNSQKLALQFIGPHPIVKIIGPNVIRLKLPSALCRVHCTFHVSRIKPSISNHLCPAPKPPPALQIIYSLENFMVRQLLDVRRRGRGLQFLYVL